MAPWLVAVRELWPLTPTRAGTLRRLPAPSASRPTVLPGLTREVSTGALTAPWWFAVRLLVPLTAVRTGRSRRLPAPSARKLAVLPGPVTVTVARCGRLMTPPDRALTEATPAAVSFKLV